MGERFVGLSFVVKTEDAKFYLMLNEILENRYSANPTFGQETALSACLFGDIFMEALIDMDEEEKGLGGESPFDGGAVKALLDYADRFSNEEIDKNVLDRIARKIMEAKREDQTLSATRAEWHK